METTGQQVTDTPVTEEATQEQTSAVQVPEGETPQENQSPKFVTQEDLERFGAELLRREKQSSRDRMKAVEDKLTAIKTRLESGGGQLSQQQVAALREQVEEDLDKGGVRQDTAPASAITPEMQAQADYVFSQIEETLADVGTQVTANDPEWKLIQDVLDNPKGSVAKVVRATEKAAMQKAERVKKGSAAARVPSGGAGQQNLSGMAASSAHDYWNTAYKK